MWNVEVQKILTFWWHWKKLFKFDHHPKKSSVKVLYWSIKFLPFFLVDRSKKKSIFMPKWFACIKMLVNDTVPIEDAHIFGFFSLYLNYINEKDTLYKKKTCRFNILRCAMMSLLVYNHCYKGIDILNMWVIFLTVKLDSFIDR